MTNHAFGALCRGENWLDWRCHKKNQGAKATTSPPQRKKKSIIQYASLGLEMGIAVILGIWGGKFLDNRLGTAPIFLWLGFGLGVGAAIKSLVNIAKKAQEELKDDDPSQSKKS
jgi:ATP synthase protein I